jgi:hypothetical protein
MRAEQGFAEIGMPDFKLPLSGDVTQSFGSWIGSLNAMGAQFSVISVNLGKSSDPGVEEQMLSDVGSYGKQLGRIEDALAVLLDHFRPDRPLTPAEDKAIRDLRRMLEDVAEVKERCAAKHGRS